MNDPRSPTFVADAHQQGLRSYCVQCRETDQAFVSRLLADKGLSWRVEESEAGATKHRLIIPPGLQQRAPQRRCRLRPGRPPGLDSYQPGRPPGFNEINGIAPGF